MNQRFTYLLLRCLRLFLVSVGYCGHLNLTLSSQTFQQKVKTWERLYNSSNHNPIWCRTSTVQWMPLSRSILLVSFVSRQDSNFYLLSSFWLVVLNFQILNGESCQPWIQIDRWEVQNVLLILKFCRLFRTIVTISEIC